MTRETLTEQQIKSKYNSISECLAICYIQSREYWKTQNYSI